MGKRTDLIGMRFGKLTVIADGGKADKGYAKPMYLLRCKCDCGKEILTDSSKLRSGNTTSCGCYKSEYRKQKNTTHNLSKTRLYKIFSLMKDRCYNPKSQAYKYYGRKGIVIHQPWLENFLTFYQWALENGYHDGLTIERIDPNCNYEPNNCIWITRSEQSRNRTSTHFITVNKTTKDITEWANELNVSRRTIRVYEQYFGSKGLLVLMQKVKERDKNHNKRIARLSEQEIKRIQIALDKGGFEYV